MATATRTIRAPRGTSLSCKGWPQEAALRMLMNNLDPDVAERPDRSEEHTSELQSPCNLVCRLLLEKKHVRHDRYSLRRCHTHLPRWVDLPCHTLVLCCAYRLQLCVARVSWYQRCAVWIKTSTPKFI